MGQEESAGPGRGVRAGGVLQRPQVSRPYIHRATSQPEPDRHRDRKREAEREGLGAGLTRQAEKRYWAMQGRMADGEAGEEKTEMETETETEREEKEKRRGQNRVCQRKEKRWK